MRDILEQLDDPALLTPMIYLGVAVILTYSVYFLVVYFVFRGKDAVAKRKMVPYWSIFTCFLASLFGLVMASILSWSKGGIAFAGVIITVTILATIGNIRNIKFCDACAATRYVLKFGPQIHSCPKCGARFEVEN